MSREFDSPWKETLDAYLGELLGQFFPHIHAEIDWSVPPENMETELQKVIREGELGRTVADRLYKVKDRHAAGDFFLLIHVEVQSQPDDALPERMWTYHYRIRDAHGRHPVGVAVLGDASPNWRPAEYVWAQAGAELRYRFNTLKLWDWRDRVAELEAMPGFIGSAVLAHLQSLLTADDPERRADWKWFLMRRLYDRYHKAEIRQAFTIIDWFLELPDELEDRLTLRITEFEKENAVPHVWSVERLATERGRKEGQRHSVASALKAKFGEVGVEFAAAELADADAATLDKVIPALFAVDTLDELRAAIFS